FNPVIQAALKNDREKISGRAKSITAVGDTINLPFIEDFSRGGIFPCACLWTDSSVFINSDFPNNPPTFGVATFDGVDKNGNPYNSAVSSYDVADVMTSKPIDLDFQNDTTIWLSFFYQPQGLGYAPAGRDSLVLEFFGSDNIWHRVWSKPGSSNTAFVQRMIKIDSTLYLYNGFRFRFMNYASLSGMLDQWNLDYIRLDRNRSASDTSIINDVAFVKRSLSVLNNYQSVPYPHYKSDTSVAMGSQKNVLLGNLDNNPDTVNHDLQFLRDDFSLDYQTGDSQVNLPAHGTANSNKNFSFHFPSISGQDSLVYYVQNIINTPDNNPANDTLLERQELYNYYAYDDGTAEGGYGLTVTGSEIAYQFSLLMTDTLRAVQMRFVPVDEDVHLHLFNILMWTNLSSTPTILASSQAPHYDSQYNSVPFTDSINGFHTYILDNPVVVGGTIYIGWQQLDATVLRLGFDKNINSSSKMFFNVTGTWQNSALAGSWMIRPVFGKVLPVVVSTGNEIESENKISVYPNPASDFIMIKNNSGIGEKVFFRIYDVMGRMISAGQVNDQRINVSTLKNGLYQIVFSENNLQTIGSRKIIISR
ncbi:MAG: T9SS type A sorting domain-containing protein, partial [Bacteroidia bacterium]|nr:T9SS type A sorting domain-containing protein [Bacteroidia bacterium]